MTVSLWLLAFFTAQADPCGMVPPIWTNSGPAPTGIERTGLQNTYVFFKDGVETIAIRPGFTGTVEQFGMLVPLPSLPSLRKIDDLTFKQMEAAIDPPQVTVHVYQDYGRDRWDDAMPMAAKSSAAEGAGMDLSRQEVVVLKEEAIGMYEVAVLEAGSPQALERWMNKNEFRYPVGMDDVVEDFVQSGWLFVAIKARVAGFANVDARAGMRSVDPELPQGAAFDGYVQGMAFRFESEEAVIPMRLSTFNGDDTHNRVYLLTEGPSRIAQVSDTFVRRQVSTERLYTNLTKPLPVRIEGPRDRIRADGWKQIEAQRSPDPYISVARDTFVSDLLAESRGELALPFEEKENELLRISEALGMRGAAVDALHLTEIGQLRSTEIAPLVRSLATMTLTVMDGDFPRDVLRETNLSLASYAMNASQNRTEVWNVRPAGPEVWISYSGGW